MGQSHGAQSFNPPLVYQPARQSTMQFPKPAEKLYGLYNWWSQLALGVYDPWWSILIVRPLWRWPPILILLPGPNISILRSIGYEKLSNQEVWSWDSCLVIGSWQMLWLSLWAKRNSVSSWRLSVWGSRGCRGCLPAQNYWRSHIEVMEGCFYADEANTDWENRSWLNFSLFLEELSIAGRLKKLW